MRRICIMQSNALPTIQPRSILDNVAITLHPACRKCRISLHLTPFKPLITPPGEAAIEETWAALQGLPTRYKRILLLREVERLPMSEVATRLRLSRAAAERRWMRAIVLMSERLARKKQAKNSR